MKKELENELKNLPQDSVILTLLPRENYKELNMHLVKIIMDKTNGRGNYVAVNRSYNQLVKDMGKCKINHKNLFFIDCASEKGKNTDNCNFLGGAESLTNIGIALTPFYKDKDFSFIFIDSLDTLSVYHGPKMVIKFARSIIDKIKQNKMNGIMLGLHEDVDQQVINELSLMCDKMIDLT